MHSMCVQNRYGHSPAKLGFCLFTTFQIKQICCIACIEIFSYSLTKYVHDNSPIFNASESFCSGHWINNNDEMTNLKPSLWDSYIHMSLTLCDTNLKYKNDRIHVGLPGCLQMNANILNSELKLIEHLISFICIAWVVWQILFI